MATSPISHFTPLALVYLLLLFSTSTPIFALNITSLLSSYPDLSDFTNLLLTTSVAADLTQRYSLTLLAVPNTFLRSSDLTRHPTSSSSANIADIVRYHVLLEYISWPALHQIPAAGKLVTTLYQTTGRATSNFGFVNITCDPATNSVAVRSAAGYSPSNATVISLIKTLPYNVSIFSLDSLLIPYGFDIMASETRPPLGLNITKVLIDGHNFNVAASMLAASGVADGLQQEEGGAGITLFVPTDDAFSALPASVNFQSLPADKKAIVLRFHVLHSYYPLGSLESIVNPVQPTLATEDTGAGRFTLNISRVNMSLAIDTGIVQAAVTQTVFDDNPVAIFGVSKVLLPKEIFGKSPMATNNPVSGVNGDAPPPITQPPVNSPGSSPPGFREEMLSQSANYVGPQCLIIATACIALSLLV